MRKWLWVVVLVLAIHALVQARLVSARSCVRVYYGGVDQNGACPAAKYEEVCSGWLAFDESCDDVMPSITPTGNWEQVMSSGHCATLLGSNDGHAVSCREGSSLPGRLLVALKWLSLLGWPPRAIAMVWTAAQQPASERAQESLFPLPFTIAVLYALVGCGWVGTFLLRPPVRVSSVFTRAFKCCAVTLGTPCCKQKPTNMPGLGEMVAIAAVLPLALSCSVVGQRLLRRCLGLRQPAAGLPQLYRRCVSRRSLSQDKMKHATYADLALGFCSR